MSHVGQLMGTGELFPHLLLKIISILVQTLYILHHKARDNLQDMLLCGSPSRDFMWQSPPVSSIIHAVIANPIHRELVPVPVSGRGEG